LLVVWPMLESLEENDAPHPRDVCTACARTAGAARASVAVIVDQMRQTVCATDDVAAHIDELQFTMGEGPCIEACRTGEPVVVTDLRQGGFGQGEAARRWPMFTGALTEYLERRNAGIRSIIGLPLRVPASTSGQEVIFGAVDLHYPDPLVRGGRKLAERAQYAADVAALKVLGYQPLGLRRSSTWWQHEANLRSKVHQAAGILMSALRLPADQALLRLHASAFAHSQTVADRCRYILAHPPSREDEL
jgi:hypothetical protein